MAAETPFFTGDIVRCVTMNSPTYGEGYRGRLTVGKVYEVLGPGRGELSDMITVLDDQGSRCRGCWDRFELAKDDPGPFIAQLKTRDAILYLKQIMKDLKSENEALKKELGR